MGGGGHHACLSLSPLGAAMKTEYGFLPNGKNYDLVRLTPTPSKVVLEDLTAMEVRKLGITAIHTLGFALEKALLQHK
jgi:hypothetical protein